MVRADRRCIAIVNTSDDVIDAITEVLEQEGFCTTKHFARDYRRGDKPLEDIIRDRNPELILWDIAPPYAENWKFLQTVLPALGDLPVVMTTTNKDALERVVGPTESLEILSKPFDLDLLLAMVRAKLRG
jgi:DNA-binding response OmpR family regulator